MQDLERRIRGYKKRDPSFTHVFISNYCKQEANVFSLSMYVVDLFGVLTV